MADLLSPQLSRGFGLSTPLPGGARAGDPSDPPHRLFERIHLTAEATAGLHGLAAEHKLDLWSIVAGAWAILLSRYSGEEDVTFGIPSPVGPSQIVPVTLRAAGDRLLLPWLSEVQEALAAGAQAESLSFQTAVLFDEPASRNDLPLVLHVSTTPELSLAASYDGARFSQGALPRILRHTKTILESMAAPAGERISEVPLMAGEELRDLTVNRNRTETPYRAGHRIHQWFEEQAARTPDATAVIFHGQQLTYRELDGKAGRLAARLRDLGAAPDRIVALCVERSLEMMVGLLGILKSGAAYLPLDPAFPRERMQFMLEDSRAAILVTQEHLAAGFPNAGAHVVLARSVWDGPPLDDARASLVEDHHLAYVIYTSGSTGKPKGVMIEHRQVNNFFAAMDQVIGTPQPGVWLAVTSISFDISVLELFWTLARGFTVVLQADSEKLTSGGDYSVAAQIKNHSVTHLQCTPSLARFLISSRESLESLRGLRKLMLGGEALPSGLVAQLRQAVSGEMYNLYGPTETTVWSAAHRIVRDEAVIPIGQPIANTQIYLLDAHLRPVPPGAPGELFIGGAGVTRGYLNRPELTAEKFLPDPFRSVSSSRMYRTGDLARYRPDGALEFLGRLDNQVKILGFRIEPEEIEATLGQHPDVRALAVVAREDVPGEKKLVAYLVPGDRPVTIAGIRAYAQHRLPAHLVPSVFVIMDALPQTPNRKIDKKALAALSLPAIPGTAPVTSGNLEETITGIFKEAMELDTVGTHDNFFDLGANSLVIAQVAATLHETLRREIPLTDLFKYPTISALTAYLSETHDRDPLPRPSADRGQSRKAALLERSGGRRVTSPEHKRS